ncbi:MAG: hypothetical protein KDJ52_14555, partial [Anaerolineae bacterium]|nr:hypothetical protein [Anaerolineae bacterium]
VLQVQTTAPVISAADDDATWLGQPAPKTHDQTIIPGSASTPSAEVDDRTFIPPMVAPRPPTVSPATIPTPYTAVPPGNNRNTVLWIMGGIIVILAGAAGFLAYKKYAVPPELPTPVVEAAPATAEPTETPTPLITPTGTSTPAPLDVPGLALAAMPEQSLPQAEANRVDPFCNSQVDIDPEAPVILGWQQRLAQPSGEIDYVAQWLASAHYDLSLDGRPITNISYERDGTTLKLWANLGLLGAGEHYLRIEQYSSRPLSTGLDLNPADGAVDEYEAGRIADGFCELMVAAPTAEPSATSSPSPTPTSSPNPTATATKQAQVPLQAAAPGIFQDFETNVTWKRGDQPYGSLTRSTTQAHSGNYSGKLDYDFPTANNDYVVFLQNRKLAGRPNGISVWVYGDGSGHFLNAWLKDAGGQTWQMSFGQVDHTGWQQMTAFIDPNQPWPSGHISGTDNKAIDYPITFSGLTLDDGNDSYSGRGIIYLDDLSSTETAQKSAPTHPQPQRRPLHPSLFSRLHHLLFQRL